jgi:hypothetical protein
MTEDEYVAAVKACGAEVSEEHSRAEYQARWQALLAAYGIPE